MAAILVPPLLFIPAGPAFAAPFAPPKPQQVPSVAVRDVPKVKASPRQAQLDRVISPAAATLPGRSVTELEIGAAAKGPFTLSDSGAEFQKTRIRRVQLEVLDRSATSKTRQTGVVMRVKRSDGGTANGLAGVTVNYSSFAHAYGGDWGTRLKLFRLPECALSTPEHVDCQPIALPSSNNVKTGSVSADVPVSSMGTLVAAAAAPSGSSGTYKATDLSPSATWQAGGSTGGFTWSYGIGTPPVPGGLAPTLGVAYSSSSVDGRTVSTNSQPTWAGEGFSLWPGFIERRYKACADDGHPTSGEQCWETHNATLSLNGSGGELLKDAAGRWHARTDDGSRIELKTGAANGVNNGEHWVVTTTDGTQYYFGLAPAAAWTVPVAGNETNEPCHGATFATSFCEQAWRWNLDKVVDRNNNVMMFFYGEEKNRYARNQDGSNTVEYVRGGWLERIEYGLRVGSSAPAPAQVVFTPADRCFTAGACDQAVEENRKNWQDSPLDQSCSSTGSCPGLFTPTFWTGKRLSKIVTQIRSGATYRDVDSWVLTHTFRKPSDTTSGVLWLDSIVRTGHTNGNIAMAPVRFDGVAMPNRADSLVDNAPPMNRFRVTNIFTETGGEISIAYSGQDCVPGTRMPAAEDNNSLRCMPVRWQPEGYASPILDWFHTYVVETVSEHDRTAGALSAQHTFTRYEYVGTPAWHADDDDLLVEPKNKSWAQFRGYGEVRVHKGDPGEEQVTSTRFFRGMHGDKLKNGSTRSVQVDGINDVDHFAGMARESVTYNGAAKVSSTVMDPWRSNPTATRTTNGSIVEARFTGTSKQRTETVLDKNRPSQFATIHTSFDAYGMVSQVNDEGQEGKAGDEKCTITSYVRNTESWLIAFPSSVEIFAKPCGTAPANQQEVISVARTHYDQAGFGVVPTKGNGTRSETMSAWAANGQHSWVPTGRSEFDDWGRIKKSTDALGYATTSAYTHNAEGLLSGTTTTNALFHSTKTQLDVTRGSLVAETDANGKKTELAWDALGRLTGVWRPGRVKGADTANYVFEYHLRTDAPSVVVTKILNPAGAQIASYQLFDGLLRQRQTQNASPAGGRILSDVFYDTAGRVVRNHDEYHAAGTPGLGLVTVVNTADIERQTVTRYDGVGRVIESVFQPKNVAKWSTTTGYGGDRTYVVPPDGGTARTVITDVSGRTTELREHHLRDTSSNFDATSYSYSQRGDLATVKDALGNVWQYTSDLRGRVVNTNDPDQGTTIATYDDVNQRTSTTDARGVKLFTTYDKLGRRTGLYKDSSAGTKLATWTYDSAPNGKGQLVSATRYVGTDAYSTNIVGYTDVGQVTGTRVSIPASQGSLSNVYEYSATYNVDGSIASRYIPGVAGELSETMQYGYDGLGNPTTLSGNLPDTPRYVAGTKYGQYGELQQLDLSTKDTNGFVYRSFTYETDTGRLATSTTSRDSVSPNYVSTASYGYDAAGNVKSLVESQAGDTQCFRYDHLRRMTNAWTPAVGGCTTDPSTSNLGGPAAYWHSYTFDLLGNRRSETRHASAGNTVATYSYESTKPHALTGVKTTAPGVPDRTDTFGYNETGSTTSRNVDGISQTIDWDLEGHVAKVKEGTKENTYVYDAAGNRILTKDSTGTTLVLPHGLQLHLSTGGVLTATRYYSFGSTTVAVRKGGKLTWLAADRHETGELSISDGTQALTRRFSLPFGGTRSATPSSWPTDKGFVGGTRDATGLTHLGAREFDAKFGRFISVDPIIDNSDPQQMNGYAYSNNAPTTFTDPDGLFFGKALKWVYKNSGTISTVFGVAAAVCAFIPVLQVAAPFLGAASLAFGLIDTYKSCSEGDGVDCGVGVVSLVPGGRALKAGDKAIKGLRQAKKTLDNAEEGLDAAQATKNATKDAKDDFNQTQRGKPNSRSERDRLRKEDNDAQAALDAARENARVAAGNYRYTKRYLDVDEPQWSTHAGLALTGEGAFVNKCHEGDVVAPCRSRHEQFGFQQGGQNFKDPWFGFGGPVLRTTLVAPKAAQPSPAPSAAAQAATNRMYAQKYAYMDKHYG